MFLYPFLLNRHSPSNSYNCEPNARIFVQRNSLAIFFILILPLDHMLILLVKAATMTDNPRPDRHRANKQRHTSALANNRKINETTKLNRRTESSWAAKLSQWANRSAIRSHSWPCLSVVVHDHSFSQAFLSHLLFRVRTLGSINYPTTTTTTRRLSYMADPPTPTRTNWTTITHIQPGSASNHLTLVAQSHYLVTGVARSRPLQPWARFPLPPTQPPEFNSRATRTGNKRGGRDERENDSKLTITNGRAKIVLELSILCGQVYLVHKGI